MEIQNMLDKQLILQRRYGFNPEDLNEQDRTQFIKENILFLIGELDEVFRELPYGKHWKKYDNFNFEEKRENAKMEIIDCWHFLMNIMLALGIDEEEFIRLYSEKNLINHKRIDSKNY